MSNFFEQLKTIPRLQFIFLLLILFFIASFHLDFTRALYLLFFCVGFTVLADIVFKAIKKRSFQIPYSAIISGLIITLIIDPSASLYQIAIICTAAMFTKNIVRFSRKHIFNPAASGLVIGWGIFGLYPSWWAPTLYRAGELTVPNILVYISVLSLAFVSCYKLKRYVTVITYLVFFAVLSFVFSLSTTFSSLLNTFLSPGNLFFAFVMLAEPITSPFYKVRQVLFGLTVAVIQVLVVVGLRNNFIPFANIPDISLVALIIANALFFKFR